MIILIAVTILSLASLGTSLLELRMSNNTEASMSAFQSAQSAIENAIHNDSQNFVVVGNIGNTNCTSNVSTSCDANNVTLPSPFSSNTQIKITRTGDAGCPPIDTSCDRSSGAAFNINSQFDRSSVGQGRAELDQGYVKIYPKMAGYFGGDSTALGN